MPEVTSDATLIIATSWQALGRAESGDERASICNCTVIIVFAAFFLEANLNHFIEKAAGKEGVPRPPGEHDGLTPKVAWVYTAFVAKQPITDSRELLRRLESEFPGFTEIREFRNGVSHGIINREAATLANAKRLRLAAKDMVNHLLEIAKENHIAIERGVEYEMAVSTAPADSAAPNNSMEPPRPPVANRVYDRFQALAGRLISRPLGRLHRIWNT
jgi:hypothetical protein